MYRSYLAESRNMADVRWSGVTLLFYQRRCNTFGSGRCLPWQHEWTPTRAAVSEFPAPSCWLYKLCISLNEGIGNKVNMLRNDGAAQDESLCLSPFSLWFKNLEGSIFSFPFPFVGRIPSKRVTRISTAVYIDINNDAIHYRNTGVRSIILDTDEPLLILCSQRCPCCWGKDGALSEYGRMCVCSLGLNPRPFSCAARLCPAPPGSPLIIHFTWARLPPQQPFLPRLSLRLLSSESNKSRAEI